MDMVDEMGNQLFLVVWMGWEEMHGDGCYQGFLLVQGLGFLGFWGFAFWARNNPGTGRCLLVRLAGGGRAGPISRLPGIWSCYLAAWESTWYPGRTEQHADYLVITSLHFKISTITHQSLQYTNMPRIMLPVSAAN